MISGLRPVLYTAVTISTTRPPNVPAIEPSQYEEIKPHNVDKEVSTVHVEYKLVW